MEIHGSDVVIDECKEDVSGAEIIEAVRLFWPDLTTEWDAAGGGNSHLFIYKNAQAQADWDRDGWSEENDTTMIYVILNVNETRLTLVIDDHKTNMPIVDAIRKAVR